MAVIVTKIIVISFVLLSYFLYYCKIRLCILFLFYLHLLLFTTIYLFIFYFVYILFNFEIYINIIAIIPFRLFLLEHDFYGVAQS